MMAHDFNKFPELTNAQFDFYYFVSPHRQITEDFTAEVVKVIDGDTIIARWYGRDFDFPVRLSNIAAPEKKERGGVESQKWLEKEILEQEVTIKINPNNRVGKWGRLQGYVVHRGIDMGLLSVMHGHSKLWEDRKVGSIPNLEQEIKKWG